MDKFIVRITAIIANLYMPIVLWYALEGIDISIFDYLFSSTFMLGIVLIVLSHSQGRYHCKWMRGLCYNTAAVPALNFSDLYFGIFEDETTVVYVTAYMWIAAVIYTLYMAVDHFRKVKTLNKKRNGIHQVNRGGKD